jgi:hypothetical protein
VQQLEVFERAVREKPYEMRIFGPPSWMVAERLSPKADAVEVGKVVEEFRAEYGLDVPRGVLGAPPNVADPVADQEMSPVDVATRCSACGERPAQAGRRQCSGCRKQAERDKKAGQRAKS